jgi:hypothetical protein
VPEFPRARVDSQELATLSPPELGQHTADVLKAAGVPPSQYQAMLAGAAIAEAAPESFAWAPVRPPA